MANLVETMERKAFGVAVDATLKNLNKDREKALLQRNLWETTSAKKRMMAREQ